ncbi:hypothetical protein GUJ93_ZPchr0012g21451 [Zizania palustris]|uniref:Uncharacterized protein n=1 Tax=Zizania palustris TaxID=103762 RepID=A0A8J6BTR6_ZIZPA|nr:hypothetical protein GUJ93_ZPchr0012g21451 [Zizania palustris]
MRWLPDAPHPRCDWLGHLAAFSFGPLASGWVKDRARVVLVSLHGADPADLPRDLLESVLDHLPVPDHLRFPSVYTTWQAADATSATACFWAMQSPWLMLPINPTARRYGPIRGVDARPLEARFLSLSDGRAYVIPRPAPAVSDHICVGSSDDWLVTADATSMLHLLNALTGAQVQLPSVTTLPFIDASSDAEGRVVSYGLRVGNNLVIRLVLSECGQVMSVWFGAGNKQKIA